MEDKKELLRSRIAKIHDPVQKGLLQDVLVDVFGELLAYSDARFSELERNIDGELREPFGCYDIYTGACKRDGLDPASRSLFEIPRGEGRGKGYLGTLFLACGYPEIHRCLKGTYHARVETDQGDFQAAVALRHSLACQDTFHWLYRQFLANQRQWRTVNCPFLYKMLDIVDLNGAVAQDAVVLKVEIDLGELSEFVMDDMALVWNLSEEIYKPRVEAGVAGNASFYAHQIPLQDLDAGYLAVLEGEDLFTTVFYKDGLVVRTQKEAHNSIRLLKAERMQEGKDHTALEFPLQTNKRKMRHVDRQALGQPRYLWTKGEVIRILSSYEVFDEFELVDVCPDMQGDMGVAGMEAAAMSPLDMNPFMKAHSFLKQKRKLALVLYAKDRTDIFRYEKMFFLLAELQLCTDEYEWVGILREE